MQVPLTSALTSTALLSLLEVSAVIALSLVRVRFPEEEMCGKASRSVLILQVNRGPGEEGKKPVQA